MEWHKRALWVWDVEEKALREKNTTFPCRSRAEEQICWSIWWWHTRRHSRKWQIRPSTYARLINFLPHCVPARLAFLGELSCSQVSSRHSDEARDRQSCPSPAEHVQSGDSALTSLAATMHPALRRLLHCSRYVIHHSCHNPIYANITNKAGVPG